MPSGEDRSAALVDRFDHVFVRDLMWRNVLRTVAAPRLRRAHRFHCRRSGWLARMAFGDRIHIIPSNEYRMLGSTRYFDERSRRTLDLVSECFSSDADRYLQRELRQRMSAVVLESVGLIMDREMLSHELDGTTCVLIPRTPFWRLLRARYGAGSLHLDWCWGDWRRGEAYLIRAVRDALYHALRIGQSVISCLRLHRRPQRSRLAVSVRNDRGGVTFENRHDLFWLSDMSTRHDVILEHHGGAPYPLSPQFVAECKARNIRLVQTYWGRTREGCERWVPGTVFLSRALKAFAQGLGACLTLGSDRQWPLNVWKMLKTFHYSMLVAERLDYLRANNIRAELYTGYPVDEPAHSRAMSEVGGIVCVAQYTSVIIDPHGNHTSTATFHLNFGRFVTDCNPWPVCADYTIANGYLYKGAALAGRARAAGIRHELERRGVRHAVCFLDEGLREGEKSSEMLLEFYAFLFERVIRERDFGIIVKPKKNKHREVLERCLGAAFAGATETGRVRFLDWSVYPGIAAQSADLTVGMLGAATIESAVVGCRTVHLWPLALVPEYMKGAQANVFTSVGNAAGAVEAFLRDPAASALGCHSEETLATLDHHRDGDVSRRIEYLLGTYLDELTRGERPNSALATTVRGFASRWGSSGIWPLRAGQADRSVGRTQGVA